LLLDCDLRNPKLHKFFGINNDVGLTHILTDMIIEDQPLASMAKTVRNINNLYIITSGFIPPNPTEILASKKMETVLEQLTKEFDLVVIDTPPVGSLTDAAILGKIADGVILVLASGETNIEMAIHAKKALDNVEAKILGAVLTKLDKSSSGYYYYKYYNYNYYYYGEDEEK